MQVTYVSPSVACLVLLEKRLLKDQSLAFSLSWLSVITWHL